MRALVAPLFLLLSSSTFAATSQFSDVSDMWWNSAESGWGLNLAQQSNVLFATLYAYSADGKAHWYVAPDMETFPVPSDRPQVFTGQLVETTGPVLAATFDPNAVTKRVVGTMTFEYATPVTGTLTYTLDGTTVTRSVRRMTWRDNDPSGQYLATLVTRSSNCAQGLATRNFGSVTVSVGPSFAMTTSAPQPADSCTFIGDYSQEGRMASSSGSYTCIGSPGGTYSLTEMETGTHGFLARYNSTVNGCRLYGNFAATRATVPEAAQ